MQRVPGATALSAGSGPAPTSARLARPANNRFWGPGLPLLCSESALRFRWLVRLSLTLCLLALQVAAGEVLCLSPSFLVTTLSEPNPNPNTVLQHQHNQCVGAILS